MAPPGVSTEFIVEAQEIVDALNRDLIAAEGQARVGEVDPDLVNNLFRSAHSLKGISGMFGMDDLLQLAHALEGVLDAMRLGRVQTTPQGLDVLFACVEIFGLLIAAASEGRQIEASKIKEFHGRLEQVARGELGDTGPDPLEAINLGEEVLGVLTEYEEHRLRENLRRGRNLFELRTSFDLSSFDVGLAELDTAIKQVGEVITKLPSAKAAEEGIICFDIIVGSIQDKEAIAKVVADDRVEIVEIFRATKGSSPPPTGSPGDGSSSAPPDSRGGPGRTLSSPSSSGEMREDGVEASPGSKAPFSTEGSVSLKSVSQTVRVDIRRLDRLMNLVGELALTKAAYQRIGEDLQREHGYSMVALALHKEGRIFERRLGELQAGIMEVRMVPLANLFERMMRAGRKIGRELGREVRIETHGEHTELDKLIVEDLADPLMHLIRNCIDHGIEDPQTRMALKKDREGMIRLSAAAQGNHVLVQVSDDGRGVNIERTVETAVKRGLVTWERAAELSRREVFNFLFLPGFSTATEVSEYSGRGVGMDVGKTNISQLSGAIEIDSREGEGTTFTVTLPITLAIIPALVVSVAQVQYAIPLNNVLETLVISPDEVSTIERREVISVRGATVPIADLRMLFSLTGEERADLAYGVVAGVAQNRVALLVDELVGQQDIVIKSLGRRLRHVRGIAGATELGNQQTILVIDMAELLNEMGSGSQPEMEAR